MMGKDPVPRSSLGKCLDFNETKKIVAVGVLSTHLSLSLSNGCCDKMGQGFPSSRLVPPHPVLRPAPCSFPAPVENGCHTNKNDTSVDNLRKQTIKSCWLASFVSLDRSVALDTGWVYRAHLAFKCVAHPLAAVLRLWCTVNCLTVK